MYDYHTHTAFSDDCDIPMEEMIALRNLPLPIIMTPAMKTLNFRLLWILTDILKRSWRRKKLIDVGFRL